MLVFAHRGYHAAVPENTLEAFAGALAVGADGIETDIRISADGLPILFHDRTTRDGRCVQQLTHAQLTDAVGYDVPTVAEALDCFPHIWWDLEIKTPAAVEAVLRSLERRPLGKVIVTSFWHPLLDRLATTLSVRCGLIVAHRPLDGNLPLRVPPHGKVDTLVWDYETFDPSLAGVYAARGVRSFVYGAHTRSEHESLLALNLDAIITDRPEYARNVAP